MGYTTRLLSDAYVYHKRRISWSKFYKQVHKFGLVRVILNSWHPESARVVYWFPLLFITAFLGCGFLALWGFTLPLYILLGYLLSILFHASVTTGSIGIGIGAVVAVLIQFFGYGYGFLKSWIAINLFKKDPRAHFPQLFFD